MSAAATAAGYLYASGRLRGRKDEADKDKERKDVRPRREVRVAVYEPEPEPQAAPRPPQERKVPKVAYRTRRWKPESE